LWRERVAWLDHGFTPNLGRPCPAAEYLKAQVDCAASRGGLHRVTPTLAPEAATGITSWNEQYFLISHIDNHYHYL